MGYEKLSVERFALSMKEGKYAGLTGARRAIGKVKDWTDAEKAKAKTLAEKHFGTEGAASSAGKPAKKAAKVAKVATKKAAKVAKKAAKAAAPKEPTVKQVRSPRTPVTDGGSTQVFNVGGDAEAMRYLGSSMVVSALMGRSSLTPLERELLVINEQENKLYATSVGSAPAETPAPPASAPRIAVPPTATNGHVELTLETMTPDQRANHERLAAVARAANLPVPTS